MIHVYECRNVFYSTCVEKLSNNPRKDSKINVLSKSQNQMGVWAPSVNISRNSRPASELNKLFNC